MMRWSTTPKWIAVGIAGAVALAGCDAGSTITAPGDATHATPHDGPSQTTPVEIDNIYSGPPPWTPGVISLDDEYVFVEILDVEQYLGRSAPASAVRIGDDWETGTPAEGYEVEDINGDGNRDIRLWWSLDDLVDDGHLSSATSELTVFGRDPGSGEDFAGSADVVVGTPTPGTLTTAEANNGSGGIFIDLTPDSPLRVYSFDTPFGGTAGTTAGVEVWTRPGSYVGHDDSPEGWTLTQTVDVVRQGSANNAAIELDTPLTLPAGETTAVYLQVVTDGLGGGIRYTGTAANPPVTTWNDDHLTLFSDVARTGTVAFGGSRFTPRTFSGNVNYHVIAD